MTNTTDIPDKSAAANVSSANDGTRWVKVIALLLTVLAVAFTVWWYLIRVPETVVLTVGAGPYRSDSYELMKEVAEVVERSTDAVRLEIVATKDSSENISMLNKGKLDIATIRSDTPVVKDVRLIANLFPDYFQLISRSDAAVRTVNDLVGKRIAIPPFGTDEFRSFWVIGDHYDLPIGGMDWRPMSLIEAKDQLLAGKIDVLFTVRSIRDRLLLNLFEDATLKNLPLFVVAVEQADAIALKRPFIQVASIPRGAYNGAEPTPRREIKTASVSRVLVTRDNVDEAAISEITRVLFEQRLDLIIRFALSSAIVKPETGIGLSAPLHPGAERYYNRDQPSFLQENAEPIALVITVFAMLFSGLLALRKRLGNTQKDRMDTYNYKLLDIAELAKVSTDRQEVLRLKAQMFEILETVVRALDTDEVTDEGFQSFSLLWDSVRELVNDRATELAAAA